MTARGKKVVPAALALVPTLLLAAVTVPAQQAIVERCRETDSDEARIACLERALGSTEAGVESAAQETAAPDPGPRPAARPDSAPQARPAPAEPSPATGPGERATSPELSDLGAEQVRARSETAAEREARLASASGLRVAAYGEVPFRRLRVELENGQVWQQIKGDTQHIRVDLERNRTVDIEESTLGGYKLRLNEMRRTIRVERIR